MEFFYQYHSEFAVLTARVFLGLLFFFQGYDAVIKIGMKQAVDAIRQPLYGKGIPDFFIVAGTWFNALTVFICGFLLIFGLFTIPCLFLLGASLIVASIGFGLHTALWDMKHVFPRLILLIFLLCVPVEWHLFSIDTLLFGF
ncbi:MAG: hypothetical protein IPM51_11425 [Sphingobacteriaceae bacterium]|nr:hypothetical protein [Sphingobacteriaceae bacterium]